MLARVTSDIGGSTVALQLEFALLYEFGAALVAALHRADFPLVLFLKIHTSIPDCLITHLMVLV